MNKIQKRVKKKKKKDESGVVLQVSCLATLTFLCFQKKKKKEEK